MQVKPEQQLGTSSEQPHRDQRSLSASWVGAGAAAAARSGGWRFSVRSAGEQHSPGPLYW